VHITEHNFVHNKAQNSSDNFPSYPLDNHYCWDDVYWREGSNATLLVKTELTQLFTNLEFPAHALYHRLRNQSIPEEKKFQSKDLNRKKISQYSTKMETENVRLESNQLKNDRLRNRYINKKIYVCWYLQWQ